MAVAVELVSGLAEEIAGQEDIPAIKEGTLISFPPTQDQIYLDGRTNVAYTGPFQARNDTLRPGESFDIFFNGMTSTTHEKEARQKPLIADETDCGNGETLFVREKKPSSAA